MGDVEVVFHHLNFERQAIDVLDVRFNGAPDLSILGYFADGTGGYRHAGFAVPDIVEVVQDDGVFGIGFCL